jgi:nucleotide-binding universal stress UspA family protein
MVISFIFYLLVAFAALLVIPWQELAASNAPLVLVANKLFGGFGFILISIGGILASASALNSTLSSQGRQIFAMGKNRFLPDFVGELNKKTKTPSGALIAGGLFVIIVLLVGDLETIAKSANFCLLASLLPVSIALFKIQRKNPEQFSFLSRALPILTIVANVGLLATLDFQSLNVGFILALVGFVIFYFYSRKRETRGKTGLQVSLVEDDKTSRNTFLRRGYRVLMPTANPVSQKAMINLSMALLSKNGGEIAVLNVVKAKEQTDFFTALKEGEEKIELLAKSLEHTKDSDVKVKPIVRASRNLPLGIVHAAQDEKCDLVVMGYSAGHSRQNINIMSDVLKNTTTDTVFLKVDIEHPKDFKPKKIAISVGGKNNLPLMIQIAGSMNEYYKGELTFLTVLPESFTNKQKAKAQRNLIDALTLHEFHALINIRMLQSDHPLDKLIEVSEEFDLLIAGTTKVGFLQEAEIGSFSSRLAEEAKSDVAIVRAVPKTKKLIKTIV